MELEQRKDRSWNIHDLPDDLLRLILLRLDTPICLIRAATTCKRWRRVVTAGGDEGRAFLRLASSLHPPTVVGHYQNNTTVGGGGRRFVPSSPAAPIDGRRFSLDFIPNDLVTSEAATSIENWEVADCHGGLVLLRERPSPLSDLVVCDPLTLQCRRIHHPPSSQAALYVYYSANMFLIDGDDHGSISISNFRVLYRFDYINASRLYMFSLADDWRLVSRSELNDRYRAGFGQVAGRVDGSLYLGEQAGVVTVLDMPKLEFCKVDLPPSQAKKSFLPRNINVRSTFAIVHGTAVVGDPDPASMSLPAAFIVHVYGDWLELYRRKVHGDSSGEWVLEHSIPRLSSATQGLPGYPDPKRFSWQTADVIAGGTGFAILSAWILESSNRGESMTSWLFSFNVDTMELQAVTNQADYCGNTRWPPPTYALPWPRFLRAGL